MANLTLATLAARLDVQAIATQEPARVLGPAQAAAAADAIRQRVADLLGDRTSGAVNAAIAAELAHLLRALAR